ncbi:MAG: CoA transferase, partial [Dehalococcoidia bacterium]
WLAALEQQDVPCAPVLERDDVFEHPQITANEMFTIQEHPQAGRVEMFNTPIRLSETPGGLRTPAPLLGQHTEEVLGELGYAAADIQGLRDRKVIL